MNCSEKVRSPACFLEILKRIPAYCLFAASLLSFGRVGIPEAAASPDFKITHRERSLQPGEVVIFTLESAETLQEVSGAIFGKTFPFYPGRNSKVWQGLIGIDLGMKAGTYPVHLKGVAANGTPFDKAYPLEIRDKNVPTRRLTVEERYVTPPKEVEERIRLEGKRVEELFGRVTPRKLWLGAFTAPVAGPAGSSFGRRSILNGKPRSPHAGTDFNADTGAPIKAPNSGKVVLAADLYFSGNTIIIDHGLGLYSFLAHLSQFSVREGAEVRTGDLVGRVGSTGRVTGPHLHWSVRLVGERVDPLSLMAVLSAR